MTATVRSLAEHPRFKRTRDPHAERVINRAELEQRLHCGKTKVFELLRAGMPHVKTRSQNLFYWSEVELWLQSTGRWQYAGGGLQDHNSPDRRDT